MNQVKHKQSFSRELLKHYVPANAIIVEAGAHIGRDTLKLKKLFPQATIHAFEPIPATHAQLVKNTRNIPDIHTYNLALGPTTGSEIMYVHEQIPALSSLLEPHLIRDNHDGFFPCKVQTISLDDWAQQYKIPKVDFMWLDMQASELVMLQASKTIFPTCSAVYIEVSTTERYKNNPLYQETLSWFKAQGYEPEIEHFHHSTWGNVLFVKK